MRGRSASAIRASAAPSRSVAFRVPMLTTVDIDRPTPPDTYAADPRPARGTSPPWRRASPASSAARSSARACGVEEAGRRRPAPRDRRITRERRRDMSLDRRSLVRDLRRRRGRRRRRGGHRAPGAAPPMAPADAVGLLYDTTLCIGCKACVVALPGGQRPRSPTRDSATASGTRRSTSTATRRTSSSSTRATTASQRSFFKAQCMHCVDPACVSRCMLGALQEDGARHRRLRPEPLRRLPLLPDRVPVQRPEVRVGEGRPEDRQVRALPHRLAEGKIPACAEVCPRRRRHLRRARRAARGGERASRIGRTAPRGRTRRRSTASTTAAARRCSTSRTCRSRSSACPTLGDAADA